MKDFGEQGYFVNIPSKFISADGLTMWRYAMQLTSPVFVYRVALFVSLITTVRRFRVRSTTPPSRTA